MHIKTYNVFLLMFWMYLFIFDSFSASTTFLIVITLNMTFFVL